jgi:WD40 repeat protein
MAASFRLHLEMSLMACTLQEHGFSPTSVCPSPDGKYLAISGMAIRIQPWWSLLGDMLLPRGPAGDLVTLARMGMPFKSLTGALLLWDLTPKAARQFELVPDDVLGVVVAFSPDSRLIATAGLNRTIRILDVPTLKERAQLQGHGELTSALAFSPDGKVLASAGSNGTVKLWDVHEAREIATLKGHRREVDGVAWSHDNRTLVSIAADSVIKIWDTQTRMGPHSVVVPSGRVAGICFSEDGRALRYAEFNGSVSHTTSRRS